MKEFTPEYLDEIRDIIGSHNDAEARAALADLHPADVAELYQDLDLSEAEYLYKLLDDETAAEVLMELDDDDRQKLLDDMPAEMIAKQIDHLVHCDFERIEAGLQVGGHLVKTVQACVECRITDYSVQA